MIHWELSNTMDVGFRKEVLEESLRKTRPEIFNTDQGSQFTSNKFTSVLASHDIKISMDGKKGRSIDNVFIELRWWSVKYEDNYLKNYEKVVALRSGLAEYFRYYNTRDRTQN